MTEVVVRHQGDSFTVTDTETGELLDPGNPDVQALAIEACERELSKLNEIRRALNGALVRFTEIAGERTTTLPGGRRIVREGGPVKEYDAHAVERGLREAGAPPEVVARIVERVTTIRVNGTEAQKAARSNPEYRKVIDAATRTVDKPFRIKLV